MADEKKSDTLTIVAVVSVVAFFGFLAFMFATKDRGGQLSVTPNPGAAGGFTIVERR